MTKALHEKLNKKEHNMTKAPKNNMNDKLYGAKITQINLIWCTIMGSQK